MRFINLTYPTYPEEIKQELAVNSFIEGLRDTETRQTPRMARLKKISEALAYALQIEATKQTSRNQEPIIRRVNVSRDYRKTNEKIFMRLIRELQEFLNDGKTQDTKNTTFGSRNRIHSWKCGQKGHLQSHCTRNTAPDRDPDGYQPHIANIVMMFEEATWRKSLLLMANLKKSG